jgi:hypothetical protein
MPAEQRHRPPGRDCSGSLPQLLRCDTRQLGATKGSYPNACGGTGKSCGNFSGKPGCRQNNFGHWSLVTGKRSRSVFTLIYTDRIFFYFLLNNAIQSDDSGVEIDFFIHRMTMSCNK